MPEADIAKIRAEHRKSYGAFYDYQVEEISQLSLPTQLPRKIPQWFSREPEIPIAGQYSVAIRFAFDELVEGYGWAVAAERVARQLEAQEEKECAGYWRFVVRNYHLGGFLPRYFALQDHVAFMINELSSYELVPAKADGDPRQVYFHSVKCALKSRREEGKDAGYLSRRDIEVAAEALDGFRNRLTEQQLSFLKQCRNVGAHRYLIGIDHMTVSIQNADILSRAVPDRGVAWHLEIEDEGPHRYTYFGQPELRYDDLQPLYKTLLESGTDALEKLLLIDAVKRAFDSHDKDVT